MTGAYAASLDGSSRSIRSTATASRCRPATSTRSCRCSSPPTATTATAALRSAGSRRSARASSEGPAPAQLEAGVGQRPPHRWRTGGVATSRTGVSSGPRYTRLAGAGSRAGSSTQAGLARDRDVAARADLRTGTARADREPRDHAAQRARARRRCTSRCRSRCRGRRRFPPTAMPASRGQHRDREQAADARDRVVDRRRRARRGDLRPRRAPSAVSGATVIVSPTPSTIAAGSTPFQYETPGSSNENSAMPDAGDRPARPSSGGAARCAARARPCAPRTATSSR